MQNKLKMINKPKPSKRSTINKIGTILEGLSIPVNIVAICLNAHIIKDDPNVGTIFTVVGLSLLVTGWFFSLHKYEEWLLWNSQ